MITGLPSWEAAPCIVWNSELFAKKPHRVFDFYLLEDRVLLSADGLDATDASAHSDVELLDAVMTEVLDPTHPIEREILLESDRVDSTEPVKADSSSNLWFEPDQVDSTRPIEVVFIDQAVEDADSLISGLRDNSDGTTQWVVVRLVADQDGIEQITQTLAALSGIDAVHVVSHGDGEGIRLGATRLDSDSVSGYAGAIASWAGALDPDADLLLYGCDLAATENGRALVEAIGVLCDCDVAASEDVTGDQSRGGDWDLEFSIGSIETGIAFDEYTQQNWSGTLATFTVTNSNSSGAGSFNQAIIDANTTAGLDTIDFNLAGSGPHTIVLTAPLPSITDAVIIDGYSQGGSSVNTASGSTNAVLNIELDGSAAGSTYGLNLDAGSDGSTIRGLVINQFELGGIRIASSGNSIAGNFIGTGTNGLTDLGNLQDGITILGNSNSIGSSALSDRNVIANNGGNGVTVASSATSNAILGNLIHSNDGLGIDLGDDGVTANDGELTTNPDQDTGGNRLQNFPTLSLASPDPTPGVVGTLASTPGTTFRIEFFASSTADVSGYGEGQRFLGFANVTTDGTGQASFSPTLASIGDGEVISATATDLMTSETSEFSSNVVAANHAPVLDNSGTMTLTTIDEDQTANMGQTIAAVIASAGGDRITDPDPGSAEGLAITSTANGNGNWEYSTNGGGSWSAIGWVSDSSALLLRETDRIRFVPNGQNQTTASLDFRAWDQTSGTAGTKVNATTNGGNSAFSSAVETADITVTAVNDAPVLAATASPELQGVSENAPAPVGAVGTLIASLIDDATPAGQLDNVNDVDNGSVSGIAVTAVDSSNGSWFYSIDNGSTWIAIGAVSDSSARLLAADANTRLYFQPNPNFNGELTSAITFRAWDQTTGSNGSLADSSINGTTTAFSVATDTATMLVNDAPVMDNSGAMTLTTISEDEVANVGDTVAAIIASAGGDRITDINTTPVEGIAITATNNGNGYWQYSLDGGSTWMYVPSVSDSYALLLRDSDRLRFVPDARNSTAPTVTFRAWDQISGAAGTTVNTSGGGGTTPFSAATETASITVTDVNDAPLLDTSRSPQLDGEYEDSPAPVGAVGTLISTLVDFDWPTGQVDNVAEVDFGAQLGIAVTAADTTNGVWYYSVDNGSTWNLLGAVSDNSARLLAADANTRLYFHPDPDYNGLIANAITFRAWDQSSGTAGNLADASVNGSTTAFSATSDTASLLVNDAPSLDNSGVMTLSTITEDQVANSGDSVAAIISSGGGDRITDVNFGAVEGIAITATDNGNGTWQFSIDGGASWANMPTVSNTSSLLLRESDLVRFVPDAMNGTAPTLTFRAWDQALETAGTTVDTSTNGGTTPFSVATEVASITVTDVNDAPALDNSGTMTLSTIDENQTNNSGNSIASILLSAGGDRVTDVDIGAVEGVAIHSLSSGNGTWEFSTDAGSSWAVIGVVSDSSALLLRSSDLVRFIPNGETGTSASFGFYAWDQSTGTQGTKMDVSSRGGITAFSSATETANITVTNVNDAPVTSTSAGNSTYVENAVTAVVDPLLTLSDVDSADFNSGQLTITISSGASTDDRLTITPAGAVTLLGNGVYHSGILVGNFAGGHGTDPLVISFNSNGTQSIAQEVGRHVSYLNVSENPSIAARTIDFVLTDGDGGTSNTSQKTLTVTAVDDDPVAVDDGYALTFDGIDDAVDMGSNASLEVDDYLTMEARVRPTAYPTSTSIILNKEGEYEFGLSSSGTLIWAVANTSPNPGWSWYDTGYVIPLNQWTHISIVYDNGTMYSYVNGRLVDTYYGSGSIGDSHPTLDNLTIGGRQNNPTGQYFSGQIDEVRLWNIARSESDVNTSLDQPLSGTEAGLLGYWSFNEGVGTSTADLTANGNNGLLLDGGAGAAGPQWTGYQTDQDTPLSINVAAGVLGNDLDIDGDTLVVSQINGSTANVGSTFTLPSGATLTMQAGGEFVYDPNNAFDYLATGQTAIDSFTYQIEDGKGGTDVATVNLTITGLNDAPQATSINAAETYVEDLPLDLTDIAISDIDDTTTTVTLTLSDLAAGALGTATSGSVTSTFAAGVWTASGNIVDVNNLLAGLTLLPSADYAADFTITVRVDDSAAAPVVGVKTMTATPVNDAPILTAGAVNDLTVLEDSGLTSLGLGAVNYGPGGGTDELSQVLTFLVTAVPDADFGQIYLADGLTTVTTATYSLSELQGMQFRPNDDTNGGPVAFSYQVIDDGGGTDTLNQSIDLNVTPVNDAPVATSDGYTINAGSSLTGSGGGVIFNDTDIDGNTLSTILVTPPSNGTVSLQPGGTFTYTPNPGFYGQDSFFYQVSDGALTSGIAEVTIAVTAVPPPAPNQSESPNEPASQSNSPNHTNQSDQPSDPSKLTDPTDSSTSSAGAVGAVPTATDESNGRRTGGQPTDGRLIAPGDLPIDELTNPADNLQLFFAESSSEESVGVVLGYSPELAQLERLLREDLAQAIIWSQWDNSQQEEETPTMVFAGVAGAGMSVFSIGYVFWALRGGALMTVFASSLPAWRFIDPIAMLSAYRQTQGHRDEGLESLMSG